MSEVRAVASAAVVRLPPEPHEKQKRGDGKEPRPRRVRTAKIADMDISEPEVHKLNVSA
jgi:hypothetical protein